MEPIPKRPKFAESTVSEPSIHQPVASLNKFPPEMLELIIRHAKTTDLLSFRQVNRQWHDISSRVLLGRNDMPIHFILSGGVYKKKNRHRCRQCSLSLSNPICAMGARSLTDLVAFLAESPLFPCTNFRFDALSRASFEGLTSFLTIWGSNVSSFRVSTSELGQNGNIWLKLLLGSIRNVKKFKLSYDWKYPPLVPSSILSSTSSMADSQFQLPKLESLHVYDHTRNYSQIAEEILTASPNLKRFSTLGRAVLPRDLEMLHSSNKLHCLRDLKISITEGLIAYWKTSQNRFDLGLRSLSLTFDQIIYLDHELNTSACDLLNHLLHTNRNCIEALDTKRLGPLTQLVFPKLERLRKLRLQQDSRHSLCKLFPLSFDWFDTFPNLKKLDIEFLSGSYTVLFDDSLKTLPSIESLRVSLDRNKLAFREIIKRTPNVKTLIIRDDHSFCSKQVQNNNFEEIATYLPKLETLCWHLHYNESVRYKMDALITGLPVNFCKKMAEKFRDKDNLSATEVPRYWKRCNPSILDLKELRNLHINFVKKSIYKISEDDDSDSENGSTNRDKAGFDSDSDYYKTGFTKVSKLLAFDQMQNLNIEIHKTKST